ncbi:flagellar biosynthesis protein FlhB [Fluoribacter gormanii]|uniref:Flagellar biosynthetic protein FlhB n=1 Tax=Fluoribacter gormanii TaxID=464 RepID=A0A377GI47_9GAMM|nr:flagellar biosynthesis protein FlhB [Fluoribacter gormanii]KTD03414.1 flagellar biosynthetic protein FlhB [Fluoribacter gormanii]MCW8443999.1 flagellar biosynthesis protein FlhB [Fluoribacter gormanii]SIQ49934.1 flagellar biosynthetic protein FlhB [Fluoribacter gormanii]STO24441.1 Flagellar biosynthetic protein flhB [Fluoribacter gormanii]
MSDQEHAQEKTEQPSAKRLRDARKKGQVARSKDFNSTVTLLFTAVGFLIFGKQLALQLAVMMRHAFEFDTRVTLTPAVSAERLFFLAKMGFWSLMPLLVIIFFVTLAAPLLMGGWVFSGQVLQPKFSRLNLFQGIKRMVSLKGFVEMCKSFFKFLLVAVVAIIVLKVQIPALLNLAHVPIETAISTGSLVVVKSFVLIAASLILIAAFDVPFQLYEHQKNMKMTMQELRDEYKETEGKPEIKSAIRRAQQEISRRRMMNEISKANVVLTNPTHYAVAISYKEKGHKAPIVVAKGKDLIAFQINKIATSHKIPIISVPPLARALYFSTKLNAEIPRGLYVAVAQVLAYVFQLRDKERYEYKPSVLQNVPIPAELARDAEEAANE